MQKRWHLRLLDASAQLLLRSSDSVDRPDDVLHELIDVLRTTIRQFSLGLRPNPFVRVQFRGIRGKVFKYADEDVDGAALREARPCAYWSYPARQSPGGGDAAASGVGKDIPLPVRYCHRKDSSRGSTAAVWG